MLFKRFVPHRSEVSLLELVKLDGWTRACRTIGRCSLLRPLPCGSKSCYQSKDFDVSCIVCGLIDGLC